MKVQTPFFLGQESPFVRGYGWMVDGVRPAGRHSFGSSRMVKEVFSSGAT